MRKKMEGRVIWRLLKERQRRDEQIEQIQKVKEIVNSEQVKKKNKVDIYREKKSRKGKIKKKHFYILL